MKKELSKTVEMASGKTLTVIVADNSFYLKGDAWEGVPDKHVIKITVSATVHTPSGEEWLIEFTPNDATATYTPSLRWSDNERARSFWVEVGGKRGIGCFRSEGDYNTVNTTVRELVESMRNSNADAVAQRDKAVAEDRARDIESAEAIIGVPANRVFASVSAEREWRRGYNDLHNEGGDGYIPPTTTAERVEWAKGIMGAA